MPVRMMAIEELGEGAIGQRRRHLLQLQQPVEPQVADAIELALLEARLEQHVAHQLEAAREIALQRRQAEHGRVVPDVDVELRADPAERLVHVQGGAIAAAFVEHVAGDRGQPGLVRRIRRRPGRHEREHRHQRHLVVLDRPDPQAVLERAPADRRKAERTLGSETGKTAAIGPRHDTATGCEPPSARATRPRGTTLSTTRAPGFSHFAAACRSCSVVAFR